MNQNENNWKSLSPLELYLNVLKEDHEGQWAIENQSFMCEDYEENAMYVFIKEDEIIFHTYYPVHKDYYCPYPSTIAGMEYGIGLN